jgi:hypothetical protein
MRNHFWIFCFYDNVVNRLIWCKLPKKYSNPDVFWRIFARLRLRNHSGLIRQARGGRLDEPAPL